MKLPQLSYSIFDKGRLLSILFSLDAKLTKSFICNQYYQIILNSGQHNAGTLDLWQAWCLQMNINHMVPNSLSMLPVLQLFNEHIFMMLCNRFWNITRAFGSKLDNIWFNILAVKTYYLHKNVPIQFKRTACLYLWKIWWKSLAPGCLTLKLNRKLCKVKIWMTLRNFWLKSTQLKRKISSDKIYIKLIALNLCGS